MENPDEENNMELVKKLFSGKLTNAKDLLRAHGLFKTKSFEDEVDQYLTNEWESFNVDIDTLLEPEGFNKLYQDTKKQAAGITDSISFYVKIAASIVILLSATWLSYSLMDRLGINNQGEIVEVRTLPGETQIITLSDGTEVKLNADTYITYPSQITEEDRTIYIEGEAYFSNRTLTHPLFINTTDISLAVYGESFNVSAYGYDPKISVALDKGEGYISSVLPRTITSPSVSVDREFDSIQSVAEAEVQQQIKAPEMEQGKYFTYYKNDHFSEKLEINDEKKFFAWKDGLLYFKKAGIYDVKL
ncbi:MAG: FecR domain-containing protein [Ekhidna sp.]|nr:FecR domain-containing protein [Ekhidna sp.]